MDAPALAAPPIPQGPDDLTPGWLTRALRSAGVLRDASVARVFPQILGEGEGFIGLIVRLELELDRDEPGAPRSLVAKLPTQIALNRALGEMLGSYEREIRFYAEIADAVSLRAPRHYYSAMDPNPVAGREEAALRFVNAIPPWLMRWLIPVFLWIGNRTKRRYVLLLEDLSGARVGDQVAGCSGPEAERLVRALAACQAELWNAALFDGRFWLAAFDWMPWVTQLVFRRNRGAFFREFGSRIDPRVPPIVEWLDRNGVELMRHLGSAPRTFIHGDFRLDNLFFRDAGAEDWLTVIDYQAAGVGRGPFDLAYFLTGNVPADVLPDCETALVEAYRDELARGGVGDYPRETCWRDYQLAKIFLLHRLIAGAGMFDLAGERGDQLLDRMFEGILATLPERDPDALLAEARAQRAAG